MTFSIGRETLRQYNFRHHCSRLTLTMCPGGRWAAQAQSCCIFLEQYDVKLVQEQRTTLREATQMASRGLTWQLRLSASSRPILAL
jgi:hypothetical protein